MQMNQDAEYEVVKKKIRKTQKDWIPYFNEKGMKMISAPDIYKAAKEGKKSIIESLIQDFKDAWVITSSRIIYNKENLDAEIIHDADSKVVKPKSIKVKVPYNWGESKDDSETEAYLQALFDTKDKLDEIKKVLKQFDKGRKLYLWTPDQASRKNQPVRAVDLFFVSLYGFGVNGDWFDVNGNGLSRGVIVKSAKQTAKNRGDAE